MLEYIKGTLRGIEDNNTAIIEIGGFGMAIKVSENTVSRLPELDREVFLYTYTEIRENDIILYGFADKDERQAFIDLTSVNGVGPRMAINILSKYNPDEIYMLISSKNSTALESIPGIGKKTATRIITELEEKASNRPTSGIAIKRDVKGEAVEALIALGYTRIEAVSAVNRVSGFNTEEILVGALKILGR